MDGNTAVRHDELAAAHVKVNSEIGTQGTLILQEENIILNHKH